MGHLQAFPAAADGKLRGSNSAQPAHTLAVIRRLIFAVAALFVATAFSFPGYAQSGPFAGMAGVWAGGGTVTLDDGSSERLRCRETSAVGAGGNGLNLSLVCASDSYKFDLRGDVISDRGALSGSWSESSRAVNGTLQGRGGNGNFQVVANAAGFTANISLTTRGNRQSILITSGGSFRAASISLARH